MAHASSTGDTDHTEPRQYIIMSLDLDVFFYHTNNFEKTSAHLTLHYFRSGILDIFECQGIHDVWCRDNVQPRVYDSGSLNKPRARIICNVIMVLIHKTLKKNVLDVCVWMLTLTMPWSVSWLINPRIGHSDVSLKDTTVPFKVTRRSF